MAVASPGSGCGPISLRLIVVFAIVCLLSVFFEFESRGLLSVLAVLVTLALDILQTGNRRPPMSGRYDFHPGVITRIIKVKNHFNLTLDHRAVWLGDPKMTVIGTAGT